MTKIIEVDNIDASELDVYARLTEAELRNKLEEEKGIFIAESPKVIKLALAAGYKPLSLLMERKHITGDGAEIIAALADDIPVYTASRDILTSLTGYKLTRGVLAAMKRPKLPSVEAICAKAKRIAILEEIADTTNVGAIVRSAAALGIDAVLVTPTCCDPLARRAIRVSMGTIFQVPWTRIGERPEDWPKRGMEILHKMGFKTIAMALKPNSVTMDDPRLKQEEKLAIILGGEGYGICQETLAATDYTVIIPMYHEVDSLNVAAASAVAFWELCGKSCLATIEK